MITVKFKLLTSTAEIPRPATAGSAGNDVRADEEVEIFSGEVKAVKTGISMAIPEGFECQIRSRSGLALKNQIFVANSPGTIDSDYRDEVKVLLYNSSPKTFFVHKGDRIAQLVFSQVETIDVEVVLEALPTTTRTGGFGSTGLK